MSEEEKKAIKWLKELYDIEKDFNSCKGKEESNIIKTLLNLIEKQQEEIKELKLITNTYNSYEGKDMDHTKIIIADSNYFINGTFVNKFISKDKIRKIIEELDNQNYNNYELSVALSKSLETLIKE